jgi:hypothetical protein
MPVVTITNPANHNTAMPDPVSGTIQHAVAARLPATDGDQPADPKPAPSTGASVSVDFVPDDLSGRTLTLPADVNGANWSVSTARVPNGTYTVVASGSDGTDDTPGSDSRSGIHKP